MSRAFRLTVMFGVLLAPSLASAQIDFPKTGYYVALGDSVAAGDGAMPVARGYVYQLYDDAVGLERMSPGSARSSVRSASGTATRVPDPPCNLCAAFL